MAWATSRSDALDMLTLASMLHRRLDKADVRLAIVFLSLAMVRRKRTSGGDGLAGKSVPGCLAVRPVGEVLDPLNGEMRQAGPLPDVPLIILTGTGIDAFKRAVSQGTPESLFAPRSTASSGSTTRWRDRSRAERTALSRAPGTPPSTGAIPARFCRRSRT